MIVDFEGRQHEFPDDFSQSDIAKALNSVPKAPAEPSVAGDVAAAAAIGVPKGIMGLAGSPGDVSSLIGRGVNALGNYATGKNESYQDFVAKRARALGGADIAAPSSAAIRSGVEGLTGPLYEPKTLPGKYAQTVAEMAPAALAGPGGVARRLMQGAVIPGVTSEAAGQLTEGTPAEPYARIAGAVGPQMAAQGARRLIVGPSEGGAARAAQIADLQREGVDLTAGQQAGSKRLQGLEQSLGDMTGAGSRMVERGKEQFTQAVLRRAGIDAPRATQDVMDNAFRRIGGEFDRLAANNTLRPDQAMGPHIRREIADYDAIVSPPNRAPVIRNFEEEIAQALAANNGTIPGAAYQSLRSRMEDVARRAPPEVADTVRGIKTALDQAMERHLQRIGSPDLGAWQQTRREYRNILPIERAVSAAGTDTAAGLISPTQLQNAVRDQSRRALVRGTGDLSRLARAGESVMRPMPNSGTPARTYLGSTLPAGLGMAATGVVTGNPMLMASGLATAGGPLAAGAGLMSRPVQRFLANRRQFNYAPAAGVPSLLDMQEGASPQYASPAPAKEYTYAPGEIEDNQAASFNGPQGYPDFHWVNPAGVDAFLARAPLSKNIEDRRGELTDAEAAEAPAPAAGPRLIFLHSKNGEAAMGFALIFWILMLLWLIYGSWGYWAPGNPYWWHGHGLFLFILLLLLGWHVFGAPVHP